MPVGRDVEASGVAAGDTAVGEHGEAVAHAGQGLDRLVEAHAFPVGVRVGDVVRLLGVQPAHQDVLAHLGTRVDVGDEVVDHRVGPAVGLRPGDDADLVTAHADQQLPRARGAHPGAL